MATFSPSPRRLLVLEPQLFPGSSPSLRSPWPEKNALAWSIPEPWSSWDHGLHLMDKHTETRERWAVPGSRWLKQSCPVHPLLAPPPARHPRREEDPGPSTGQARRLHSQPVFHQPWPRQSSFHSVQSGIGRDCFRTPLESAKSILHRRLGPGPTGLFHPYHLLGPTRAVHSVTRCLLTSRTPCGCHCLSSELPAAPGMCLSSLHLLGHLLRNES